MADSLTKEERSQRMGRVKGRDTKPEMVVRRIVYALGYRYRLHQRDLPGSPDIVFRKRRKVIYVHGCFWHRHADSSCKLARLPKSRLEFWLPKLEANVVRDQANLSCLAADGWSVLILWECELRDHAFIKSRIKSFLSDEVN
jgi:DNA mismatch endonuclease (patch repair protein)